MKTGLCEDGHPLLFQPWALAEGSWVGLAEQLPIELPTSPDEQLLLLFDYLCRQRVLLVLDNLESILDPAEAGRFRSGYEG